MSSAPAPSGGIVHEIRWSDALPWWIVFRAAGAAFSPTVILLAALGVAAVWAGWSAADRAGLVVPAGLAPADGGLALPSPGGGPVVADPLAPSGATLRWISGITGWLPATITEARPRRIHSVASPMAWAPLAQALVVQKFTPRSPWLMETWPAARLAMMLGIA